MPSSKTILSTYVVAGSIAMACGSRGGSVGAPCETKDDCEGELVCDEHEGQASCQEPHGHEGDGESTAHGTEATDTTHPPGTGTGSESSPDQDETGTEATSSSSGSSADSDAGPGTDTGTTEGASLECQDYCACLITQCSEYEAYPHADEQACLDACAELTPDALACFTGFCDDAAVERSESLEEHWCEHAWGELGTDKC